jgi:hypothetical protein
MRLFYTDRFLESYEQAPVAIQGAFDRRVALHTGESPSPFPESKEV